MASRKLTAQQLLSELTFTTARSSGPGGQNVNKVESKVILKWDIANSMLIAAEERELLRDKLKSFISREGMLSLTAQESRSQLQNKQEVLAKLDVLLAKAFVKKKVRRATKPSKSAVQKRITGKKLQSEKKQWRQKLD